MRKKGGLEFDPIDHSQLISRVFSLLLPRPLQFVPNHPSFELERDDDPLLHYDYRELNRHRK